MISKGKNKDVDRSEEECRGEQRHVKTGVTDSGATGVKTGAKLIHGISPLCL